MPSVSNLEGRAIAIRRWRVHPDIQVPVNGEWLDVVSREALVHGILDGVAMLDRTGGVLTVIVGRAATELDGEMVTTGAVVEHKNRSDAKPQPEEAFEVPVHGLFDRTEPEEPVADFPASDEVAESEPDESDETGSVSIAEEPSPDGLDYNALPDEDLSDIPVHAR